MSQNPKLEAFSPEKFVKGIPTEQLAVIAEFVEEAETQLRLLTRAGKTFAAPTGRDMLLVFQAAEAELIDRFAVELEDPEPAPETLGLRPLPERFDDYRTTNRLPRTGDSEWLIEMRDEVLPVPENERKSDKDDGDEEDGEGGEKPRKKKRKGLRLPAILPPRDIQKMFDVTRDHQRNHLVIRVLYASGIRRQELVTLRVADLYLDRNVLFVRGGKADKDRYVLIDSETSRLLAEYTKDLRLDDIVFNVSTRTINRIVDEASELSGVEVRFNAMGRKFTVHTLRHCFATHMYERGADLFLLKTLLGHLFLSVTKMYIHVGVGSLAKGYNRSHPLARALSNPLTDPLVDQAGDLSSLEDDE